MKLCDVKPKKMYNHQKRKDVIYKVNPCVAFFEKQWVQLATILKALVKEKKEIHLESDNVSIMFLELEQGITSCGKCATRYRDFQISGIITGKHFQPRTENEWFDFSASISQNDLHQCENLSVKDLSQKVYPDTFHMRDFEECIFLNGHVENTRFCVFQVYVPFLCLVNTYLE